MDFKKCPKCGKDVLEDQHICPNCQTNIATRAEEQEDLLSSLLKEKKKKENVAATSDILLSIKNGSNTKSQPQKETYSSQQTTKEKNSAFLILGIFSIVLGIILMLVESLLTNIIYIGIAMILCSIPFFALHVIINLLIDIYNKIK